MAKKIAVIGAGPSGLAAIKTFKDAGHHVTCFESLSDIGGLWNYDLQTDDMGRKIGYISKPPNNNPTHSCYKSLKFITLSYTNILSDYVPEDWSVEEMNPYMHPWEYLDYLRKYTDKFKLRRYIQFKSTVVEINKLYEPGGWVVKYQNSSREHEKCFDYVIVGTGAWSFPNTPTLPGIDQFKGLAIHSCQVRNEETLFKNKNILVIGGGFSGGDMIASALKYQANKIYFVVSSRPWEKNHWMLDRYIETSDKKRVPWQSIITRHNYVKGRHQMLSQYLIPLHQKSDNEILHPADSLMVNDTKLISGAIEKNLVIKLTENIANFDDDGKSIHLLDGTTLKNIDIVLFGTGFVLRFPFLDKIWSPFEQMNTSFYNNIVCTNRKLDGIGFLCLLQGQAGLSFITEIQCQWLSETMCNKEYNVDGSLYSNEERIAMESKIRNKVHQFKMDKMPSLLMGNPFAYVDRLAEACGYKVPSVESLLNDNEIDLAVALYHGPLTGAHYRLNKHDIHKFEKAKKFQIKVAKTMLGEEFDKLTKKCKEKL